MLPDPAPLPRLFAGLVDHRLEGAACTGRAPLFDVRDRDEDDTDFADRLDRARAICRGCPVRLECHEVAQNLRPRDRGGVWAGTHYDRRGIPDPTTEGKK